MTSRGNRIARACGTPASPDRLYDEEAKPQWPGQNCSPEYEDPMSLTGAEWDNIQARIESSVSSLKTEISKEIKGKKWPDWLRESLAASIVMVGASFIIVQYIPAAIHSETASQATNISSLKASVDQIKQDVRDIKTDIKDTLNRALDHSTQGQGASATDRTKRSAIEKGTAAIKLANDFGVDLDAKIVSNFGQKAATAATPNEMKAVKIVAAHLSQTETTNGESTQYWPAVLKFVQSVSAATSSFVQQPGTVPVVYKPGVKITTTASGTIVSGGEAVATGPIVGKSFTFNGGVIEDVTFVRCRIQFTNLAVSMHNVRFVDCIFVLPVTENPPAYMKQFVRSVLASDFKTVTINSLS